MRLAITATIVLWALIFGLIYLCFPGFLHAETKTKLPRFPTIEVYWQPGNYQSPYNLAVEELKVWRRHGEKIFGVRLRFNVSVSPIQDKCPGIFMPDQAEQHFWCLWDRALDVGLDNNNKILHFLTPPLYDWINPNPSFWIGGLAFESCFKNLHPNGSAGGFGVSNFVQFQRDGTSRLTKSEAAFLHEIGHHTFKMSHDGPEDDFLMNTNFNRLGFSERTPPELWKLSKRSKKQMNKCMNFRARGK